MALSAGTRLGPYEILAALGAGGMGEVYRARDTRLDRTVAIKVLPPHLSSNPDLKVRFEREAKAISSLSHPHICTLHDVGHQDGIDFLVMEYLEGETLADRLERGPLPLKQALELGIQMAEALEKAHKSGIVHRDLKPGNIMLTKSGAKLMDFGLAKPTTGMAAMASDSVETMSKPLTGEGKIVGTFQYMSPEQLEGKNADACSDIFALGAVLYEMVTGKRAFTGKSQISVMSAILEKEPEPVSAVQPLTPPSLEHVIRNCLAKEREQRYQSAADVRLELRWIAEEAHHPITATPLKQWRHRLAWALAGAVAAAGLTLAATKYTTPAERDAPLVVSVLSPASVFPATSGRNGPPQISPEGNRIAFVGCKSESASLSIAGSKACSIWLRSLRSTDTHEVAGTDGGYFPFWSPDGRELGFFADGKLKRVAAEGGPVQVVCDAEDARGGSWGTTGTIIFAATRSSPIFRVPAEGGVPVAVTHSAPVSNLSQVGSHRWPYFLPDGEHFIYVNAPNGSCSDRDEMHFASLDGRQDVALKSTTCSNGAFAAGHLIYWRDGNLVAQAFDPVRGALNETAVPIIEHAAFDLLFSIGEFSASADGKAVYVAGEGPSAAQLVWYDRGGKVLGSLGENAQYASVAISRDGSRVVADTNSLKNSNIRILDARGTRTLLTFGSGRSYFPVWSANGRQIYFTSDANGPYNIYARAADGSGNEQPVLKFDKGQFGAALLAASPDGQVLAFVSSNPDTKLDIYTVALTGDRKPRPFVHSPANESAPSFSSNGRWLAYESDYSGRNEIYVTPFPAGDAQHQVSTHGGERPVWRRDGKEIFYRENFRLMAVEVKPKGETIELGTPKFLFEVSVRNLAGRWYDVSPDGRFLMNASLAAKQAQNFELLVNWPAELKK